MSSILISSSVLILALAALRRLLRGRIRPRLQYALWLLVAMRLLVPIPLPQSDFSVLNVLPPDTAAVEAIPSREVTAPETNVRDDFSAREGQISLSGEMVSARSEKKTSDMGGVLRTIWALGAVTMAVWFSLVNLIFSARARKGARPLEETESPVPVYESSTVTSPCLVGLVNQRIYVTPACAEDPVRLRHVLNHELTHRCQGDPWWSLVRAGCLCVYWFDPLVWWAAALSRRDCELACDEGTIRYLGEAERFDYGRTLVDLAAAGVSPGSLLQTATTMSGGNSALRERVALIARKPRMLAGTGLCLLAVMAVVIACTFTDAELGRPGTAEPREPDGFQTVSDGDDAQATDESAAEPPEPAVPSEEAVLEARAKALEGMSRQQAERLTETVKAANLALEHQYLYNDLFEKLSDPDSLYWNYFDETGEIQIDWAVDGTIDMDAVCKRENLSSAEFYARYGTPVVTTNRYDADRFSALLSELESSAQNETLKIHLRDLADQVRQAKETHSMEIANEIYKKLHDLDYFLLRYGPSDLGPYVTDSSTITTYYGTLPDFQ